MKKLVLFFQMDHSMKRLLIESFLFLGWARILKAASFSRLAPKLGYYMEETELTIDPSKRKVLSEISQAIHIMSRYTFWESQCLVKAIAAMKMLEKRSIESTLYLGTAREETGELIAHAWLRCGPHYLTGSEGMKRFTVVGKFAMKFDHLKKGESNG